jgi:hypothetical protein
MCTKAVSARVKWQSRLGHATRRACPPSSRTNLDEAQHTTQSYSQATMIRHDYSRIDPKRRANLSHKKKQFAKAEFQEQTYEHRLNFYVLPPTAEITLEEFEQWAIDRLKGTRITLRLAKT